MKTTYTYLFVIAMLCYVSLINKRDDEMWKQYEQNKAHKEYCAYHYNSPTCK